MPRRLKRRFLSGINRLLILVVLGSSSVPIHGYQIAKVIKILSKGKISINMSTVYAVLRDMEKNGLARSVWRKSPLGPPRRCYIITELGSNLLADVVAYLKAIVRIAEQQKYGLRGHGLGS